MKDPVILLNPADNVVVCRRPVSAGERIDIAGQAIVAARDVDLGHKIARIAIGTGLPVIKYGIPIGAATTPIAPGEWVHLHNMRSNYIATHTRERNGSKS